MFLLGFVQAHRDVVERGQPLLGLDERGIDDAQAHPLEGRSHLAFDRTDGAAVGVGAHAAGRQASGRALEADRGGLVLLAGLLPRLVSGIRLDPSGAVQPLQLSVSVHGSRRIGHVHSPPRSPEG
jgi:hypothetical protein